MIMEMLLSKYFTHMAERNGHIGQGSWFLNVLSRIQFSVKKTNFYDKSGIVQNIV